MTNATVCELGYYKIAVSAEPKGREFFLWRDNGLGLQFSERLGLNVWDWNAPAGSPKVILTLQDWDGRGFFNRLQYTAVDAAGSVTRDVVDLDLDGQPDLRLPPPGGTGTAQIWWNGAWRDLHHRDKQSGILEAGQFIEIEFKNGAWRVKE